MISYSIIVPVYNEEENILPFYNTLLQTIDPSFELIWINDGSNDHTMQQIRSIAEHDTRVKCISFSRNFGHQSSLLAGLKFSRGERIVFMDGDLQHPPALLPMFFKKLDEGYDLVSGKKTETANIQASKRIFTRWFYSLINFLSDTRIEPNVSDFRAFNRKVAGALLQFDERELFLRGVFNWIGFRTTTIDFHAPARNAGQTKYSFRKMIQLGLKGAIGFSFKPIRIALFTGLCISTAALIFVVFAVIAYFRGNTVPGWASIIISIMLLGGIQLSMIGLIGEYIASFFIEIKKRPLFLVDDKINFTDEEPRQPPANPLVS